jgi:hypothetical protein
MDRRTETDGKTGQKYIDMFLPFYTGICKFGSFITLAPKLADKKRTENLTDRWAEKWFQKWRNRRMDRRTETDGKKGQKYTEMALPWEYRREKYHCTIDLLFDLFG